MWPRCWGMFDVSEFVIGGVVLPAVRSPALPDTCPHCGKKIVTSLPARAKQEENLG
mgnify:CR=1 FL=1